MLLKNTYEGVHLIVKLPTISLQASRVSHSEGGGGVFQMGGFIFKWEGVPHGGALVLVGEGGGLNKIVRWRGCSPQISPTMGNPALTQLAPPFKNLCTPSPALFQPLLRYFSSPQPHANPSCPNLTNKPFLI